MRDRHPDGGEASEPRAVDPQQQDELEDLSLRPRSFGEYIGRQPDVDNLKVYVKAAQGRHEPLEHVLISGPPGLGKTTLAHVIANELGVGIHVTSGPALERKGDLAGILTNLGEGDLLFVDEIHRLNAAVEENLYPAMEDFQFDIVLGSGPHARSYKMPLKRFTLVGATTRAGMLTSPLRDRFGIPVRLDYYDQAALDTILDRAARILDIRVEPAARRELASRARGTPRVANRLLRRLRDFAQVEGSGVVDPPLARLGLERLGIDGRGLDELDRRLLSALMVKFSGGPVGLETLAAALGEDKGTIEDVVEPYLLREGLLQRTPRGRVPTPQAYQHLGLQALGQGRQLGLPS